MVTRYKAESTELEQTLSTLAKCSFLTYHRAARSGFESRCDAYKYQVTLTSRTPFDTPLTLS